MSEKPALNSNPNGDGSSLVFVSGEAWPPTLVGCFGVFLVGGGTTRASGGGRLGGCGGAI